MVQITKNAHHDLSECVSDIHGKMPVFGYPLICFSPKKRETSYWSIISK